MPHTVSAIAGGNATLVNGIYGTSFTAPVASFPFYREKVQQIVPSPAAFGPGAGIVVTVPNAAIFTVGEFVEIQDLAVATYQDLTSITAINIGLNQITLKSVANTYTQARIYKVNLRYDMLVVVDPNVLCLETTVLSLYANPRDYALVIAVWNALTAAEFTQMVAVFNTIYPGISPLAAGTRVQQIAELYGKLLALTGSKPVVTGPGTFNPDQNPQDGGAHVSYASGSFEDQFEDVTGTATFDEYSFEAPFDLILTGASIITVASTGPDAYVTIQKNGVDVVGPGPVPPNRNLPAVTGVQKSVPIANVPVAKGDKLTVRLNLVLANTIKRAAVVLAYASLLKNLS